MNALATKSGADVIKANPLMRFAIATYSYTQEYGSDGCWSSTETRTCTLGAWVNENIYNRHPGNRSYNFTLDSIEEVDNATLLIREAEYKAKKELERQEAAAKRNAEVAAKNAFNARIAAWVGVDVTVRGAAGRVERAMESRYDEGKIALLIRYVDGTKKWHGEGAVKRA